MGKKSKAEASTGSRRRKRGFIRRTLRRMLVMAAVSAAVKYFSDSGQGEDRRKRAMGLVGR
jgi:hypothetical protein